MPLITTDMSHEAAKETAFTIPSRHRRVQGCRIVIQPPVSATQGRGRRVTKSLILFIRARVGSIALAASRYWLQSDAPHRCSSLTTYQIKVKAKTSAAVSTK